MNKVCVSETEGSRRGKPVVRKKDRVKEYMHERLADRVGGIELARKELEDREIVEAFLPWPSPCGRFLEGTRRQRLK